MHTASMLAAPRFASGSAPSFAPSSSFSAEFAITLLGPSAAMSQLWVQLRRLAPHVRTVLLTGDAGCGQDAAARLLHDLAPCPQRPFLALHAGEAEERLGRASGFSSLPGEVFLFLPELDRLSSPAQQNLIRLLGMRRAQSLTVVAACGEDLRALASLGSFSAELAQTMGSVRVALPALRERPEDLPMLLSQMLASRSHALGTPLPQPSEELLRAAMQYAWPGNLPELSGVAEFMLDHADSKGELRAVDLQRALRHVKVQTPAPAVARMVKLDEVVQEHICAVLRACRGNKLRAAEILGISRSTLYRMLDAATQSHSVPVAS